MKAKGRLVCLTFHTERLHNTEVWKNVLEVTQFLESKGISATWFSIAPIHPVYVSRNFTPDIWAHRLKELSNRKQLIEQHTHFYGEAKEKPYDLSWANLEKRLLEDKNWLESLGFEIKGFVGGGWATNEDILRLLILNDYRYDCTAAMFKSNYLKIMSQPHPARFVLGTKSLIEIPTCSSQSVRWSLLTISGVGKGRLFHFSDGLEFCIVYLHDYDLTSWRTRKVFVTALNILSKKVEFVSTHQLLKYLNPDSLDVIELAGGS